MNDNIVPFDLNRNILPFNENSLFDFFFKNHHNSWKTQSTKLFEDIIDGKATYIYNYLKVLDATYIVKEDNYLSRDFTVDHSLYYYSSFKQISKHCIRLHFFSRKEEQDDFSNMFERFILKDFTEEDDKKFKKSYLGCIVIKPIEGSIIGYTLLKNYNDAKVENTSRILFGIRKYTVHLFGRDISFETLAYQEQDNVLASCASLVVWFVQQKALITNFVIRKSPGEITKDVGNLILNGNRIFPNNDGLKIPELCKAIQKNGLEPIVREYSNGKDETFPENKINNLKRIIYSYEKLGIPIILILREIQEEGQVETEINHAIAISGFTKTQPNIENISNEIKDAEAFKYCADHYVEKFYAHDDQKGPFVNFEFKENSIVFTQWYGEKMNKSYEKKYDISSVVMPSLPRIKIDDVAVRKIIEFVYRIIGISLEHWDNGIKDKNNKNITDEVVQLWKTGIYWDIKLMYGDQYKEVVREKVYLSQEEKLKILTKAYPKTIWVVTAKCLFIPRDQIVRTEDVLEIIIDAGGLLNEMLIKDIRFNFDIISIALNETIKIKSRNLNDTFWNSLKTTAEDYSFYAYTSYLKYFIDFANSKP